MLIAANSEEKALLALIANGDRKAFAKIYIAYLNNLHRYIFLFTKSEDETREILQEIFVKLWDNREKLPEIGSFENYLFRTAKNKLLDKIRQLQIRQRVHLEIERSRLVSENTTSDQCAYREYYKVVQQAIEKLPPKRKLIFRLNIENGLSQDEIAAQLNISKSVVQKQIYRASDFVKKYLVEHGEIAFSVQAAVFPLLFIFNNFC